MNRGWGWLFAVASSVVVGGTRLHGAVQGSTRLTCLLAPVTEAGPGPQACWLWKQSKEDVSLRNEWNSNGGRVPVWSHR